VIDVLGVLAGSGDNGRRDRIKTALTFFVSYLSRSYQRLAPAKASMRSSEEDGGGGRGKRGEE